jgi:hypothetical protein
MSSTCITSLDLCAIRVAKLNAASGAPVAGASNGYVSVAPQKLEVTVEVEKGDEKTVKNGCGALMAILNESDKIKSISFATDYCQLDAELMEIKTGAAVFSSGGNAIGYQLPAVGDEPPHVCFEAWSKAWDVDHQYISPFTDPDGTYIHWVFPNTQWVQDKFTLEHDLLVVPVNGKGSENPSITANGPFDDWPSAIANAGGVTRLGGWFFDDTIPANDDCEYIAVTSAAS